MSRPRLLDLFCGAGGAAMGYHRAGFDVVGVDIAPQPYYPFEFIQADALKPPVRMEMFDAIHASPPCQGYTTMSYRWRGSGGLTDERPKLIGPTRELLRSTGLPYIIENVEGARSEMEPTLRLHGGMFGLRVHRPRYFECSFLVLSPVSPRSRNPLAVYGDKPDGRWLNQRANGERQYAPASLEEAQEAMGMGWADWHGTKEAIPPAYTEFIGRQLIDQLERAA